MSHYEKYATANADPVAVNMLGSFRALGYSMEAAVADILDNSIAACAKNIWIDFEWRGKETTFSIRDDGWGMNNDELIQAMRFGARDPYEVRHPSDLGRFGLGLKTASFSQSRKFTVVSKKKGQAAAWWTWDLDYVYNYARNWVLIDMLPEGSWLQQLESSGEGTIVIWHDIDRHVKHAQPESSVAKDRFLKAMQRVKQHIATVFHRYIEQKRVKIIFGQREVQAWNPFMETHHATQVFPEEPLNNGEVAMRGFVLPHKSKLTPTELEMAEGVKGWNAQQGFYIYRKDRILVAGSWFHLFPGKERYNLARIAIDLPNHLDGEWLIDIKKSKARLPANLKDQIYKYACKVRISAAEVYYHRGKVVSGRHTAPGFQPVWLEKQLDGKSFFVINREHPLIAGESKQLGPLLRLLEETLPVTAIFMHESEYMDSGVRPFEKAPDEELKSLMRMVYGSLLQNNSEQQAKDQLKLIVPFNEYPDLIEKVMTSYEQARNICITILSANTENMNNELIAATISRVRMLFPLTDEEQTKLQGHLEELYAVFSDKYRILDDKKPEPWVNNAKAKISWGFWNRYRKLLELKGYAPDTINKLDNLTDDLLDRLVRPGSVLPFDKRGLIVGHVQSGKTGNYTGLICKAADAGYRLIIVLAGIHNSLRSQTQMRIDEGFLGFDTQLSRSYTQNSNRIGVGNIDPNQVAHSLTTNEIDGDFNRRASEQSGINIRGNDPIILVIKKNVSVMKNLLSWLAGRGDTMEDGRKLIRGLPLLVIDDEADNASINISKNYVSGINACIRSMLRLFEQSVYLGYTATPFANIFIKQYTDDDVKGLDYNLNKISLAIGHDVFPKNFIVNIPAPSNYIGPEKIFGTGNPDQDNSNVTPLKLYRIVKDYEDIIPAGKKNESRPKPQALPASMLRAIRCFFLSCAARRARGQGNGP